MWHVRKTGADIRPGISLVLAEKNMAASKAGKGNQYPVVIRWINSDVRIVTVWQRARDFAE